MENLWKLSQTPNGRNLILRDIVREFGDALAPGERSFNNWSEGGEHMNIGHYVVRDGSDEYLVLIKAAGPQGCHTLNFIDVTRLPSPFAELDEYHYEAEAG